MDDNTAKVLLEGIHSIPMLIGGLGSVSAGYFAYKAKITSQETKDIAQRTEHNTNGMKDELMSATKLQYFAAGKLSEKGDPDNLYTGPPRDKDTPSTK